MKYKVGDKVKIVDEIKTSIETPFGTITIDSNSYSWIKKWLGKVVTIDTVNYDYYTTLEIKGYYLNDEMIERLVEEEKVSNANSITRDRVDKLACKNDEELPSGNPYEWECPEGYIFKDENGNVINATKIVLEKKEKEYPKTYEECAKVLLDRASVRNDFGYKGDLLVALQRLLVRRDAYWKIAGEEMGLGKLWEPDWNTSEPKYVIACTSNGIVKQWENTYCKVFAFPTKEMRDAFYENFKELIEICQELL